MWRFTDRQNKRRCRHLLNSLAAAAAVVSNRLVVAASYLRPFFHLEHRTSSSRSRRWPTSERRGRAPRRRAEPALPAWVPSSSRYVTHHCLCLMSGKAPFENAIQFRFFVLFRAKRYRRFFCQSSWFSHTWLIYVAHTGSIYHFVLLLAVKHNCILFLNIFCTPPENRHGRHMSVLCVGRRMYTFGSSDLSHECYRPKTRRQWFMHSSPLLVFWLL